MTSALWDGDTNTLTITGDANSADSIVVSTNGSDEVTVTDGSAVTITNGPIQSSAVDEIIVNGQGGADSIDLSEVKPSRGFTNDLNGNVSITGGSSSDTITGSAFDDSISAGAGQDIIEGGPGNDDIDSGDGADTYIYSGTSALGTDTISSLMNDEETIDFSQFNHAGYGVDFDSSDYSAAQQLNAGGTAIYLDHADAGAQLFRNIIGTANADSITGDAGADSIIGGNGNDTIVGGGGNDTILGGEGSDSLVGGSGDDTYVFSWSASQVDEVVDAAGADGGDTGDTLDFSGVSLGYGATVNLGYGGFEQNVFSAAIRLKISNSTAIEKVIGTSYADVITGNSRNNTLYGGDGNDSLYGEGGDDDLYGEGGTDSLDGGSGTNNLYQ